jgi:hypothetical protein
MTRKYRFKLSQLVALTLMAIPAWPQLHLILGRPHNYQPGQYGASSAALSPDGVAALTQTIVDPNHQRGLVWADIDYDFKQAYFLDDHEGIAVLDLTSDAVVKRCETPRSTDMGPGFEWRIVDPVLGPVFTFLRSRLNPRESMLFGMVADPAVSCAESFLRLRDEQIGGIASGGQAGAGNEAPHTIFTTDLDRGTFRWRHVGGEWTYLPIHVAPKQAGALIAEPGSGSVVVRTTKLEAVATLRDYWARLRPDGEWIRIPSTPGQDASFRAFGHFLAWPESINRAFQEEQIKSNPALATGKVESAGREEWRKTDTKWGLSTEWALDHYSPILPGVLHILGVQTGRTYLISTHQADSEVLLIEDNVVYYRVSDRLYRSEIQGDVLTSSKQIGQSDLIRDAHWAFIPMRLAQSAVPEKQK